MYVSNACCITLTVSCLFVFDFFAVVLFILPGLMYQVELSGNSSFFRGFVVQAVNVSEEFVSAPIGQFSVDSDSQYKHLNDCTLPNTLATVSQLNLK